MPEREFAKELITNQEWHALIFLFVAGLLSTLLKLFSGDHKVGFWKWIASGALGGFVTAGIGAFLLWLFPTMPFYIVLGMSGGLTALLSNKDMQTIVLNKLNGKSK